MSEKVTADLGRVSRVRELITSFAPKARGSVLSTLGTEMNFWPGPFELAYLSRVKRPGHNASLIERAKEVATKLTRTEYPSFALSDKTCRPEALRRYGEIFLTIHRTPKNEIEIAVKESRPLSPAG